VIAERDAIGNTRAMTAIPPPTPNHRWLGWHAPAMRRTVLVGSSGLIAAVVLLWFVPWGLAAVAGWDVAALAFLTSVWPIIGRADSSHAAELAKARGRDPRFRDRALGGMLYGQVPG
jgi:hypothetical protein